MVKLTIFQQWVRRQAIVWINDGYSTDAYVRVIGNKFRRHLLSTSDMQWNNPEEHCQNADQV